MPDAKLFPFSVLALGARFQYVGYEHRTWVKISDNYIAEWDEKHKTDKWIGQQVCSFTEDEKLDEEVVVL